MAANTNHRPMGPRPGGHGPGGMMPGEKARDFKGSMKKLLGYLAPFLPGIVVALVCAAASTGPRHHRAVQRPGRHAHRYRRH